jgi:hypothetical protein
VPDSLTASLGEVERFFRRQGLAALCERTDPTTTARRTHERLESFTTIWSVCYLVAVVTSVLLHWFPFSRWWFFPAMAITVVTVGVENATRADRRPGVGVFSGLRPILNDWAVGSVFGVVVVFLLLWLVAGVNWISAFWIAVGNVAIYVALQLGSVFVFTVALPSLGRNATQALWTGFSGSMRVAARGLPLVFLVLVVLFFTADTWRFVADGASWRFWIMAVLLAALPVPLVILWIREECERLYKLSPAPSWLAELAERTPARPLVGCMAPASSITRRGARFNIALSMSVVVLVRVVSVGILTAAVFLALGAVRMEDELGMDFLHHHAHTIIDVAGITVSSELIRVAAMLGILAGGLFAITTLTKEDDRHIFINDQLERLREAVAAWSYYSTAVIDAPSRAAVTDATTGPQIAVDNQTN